MNNIDIDVNAFPSLTWNFLNINKAHLSFSTNIKDALKERGVPEKERDIFKDIKTGLGSDFDSALDSVLKENNIASHLLDSGEKPSVQKFILTGDKSEGSICDIVIHAKRGCETSFIFVFKSESDKENLLIGSRIKVLAEEESKVHIITVNLLGKNTVFFNSIGTKVLDNASVEITQIELGAKDTFSGFFNLLEGEKSFFCGRVAFALQGGSFLDMNHVSHHLGRKSESTLSLDGVLSGSSKKTWRGTIDFKKGCEDSKGDEQEDVLLLSPGSQNKSLPVILCDEEAVEGRHGCSLGKIDSSRLFYMQSRGLDETTSKRLLSKAKIEKVTRFIRDPDLVDEILSFTEENLF